MRIAYIAHINEAKPVKETQLDRCMLMIKNQRIKDRQKAEKLFANRLANVELKLKQLGI